MFEFESGLIFWNTLSFAILVLVMYKWALPPLIKMISLREKTIADSLSMAEASQKKSEELLKEYKEKIHEANEAANRIIDRAKDEGGKIRDEIHKQANKEAGLILTQTRRDLAYEKEKIVYEAKKEIVEIVALAAGKLMRKTFSKDDDRKVIEEALQ